MRNVIFVSIYSRPCRNFVILLWHLVDLLLSIFVDLFFRPISLFCDIFCLFTPVSSLFLIQSLLRFDLLKIFPRQVVKFLDRTSFNWHNWSCFQLKMSYLILQSYYLCFETVNHLLLSMKLCLKFLVQHNYFIFFFYLPKTRFLTICQFLQNTNYFDSMIWSHFSSSFLDAQQLNKFLILQLESLILIFFIFQ